MVLAYVEGERPLLLASSSIRAFNLGSILIAKNWLNTEIIKVELHLKKI